MDGLVRLCLQARRRSATSGSLATWPTSSRVPQSTREYSTAPVPRHFARGGASQSVIPCRAGYHVILLGAWHDGAQASWVSESVG